MELIIKISPELKDSQLARAVEISLFTYGLARADDALPHPPERYGWWGDSFSQSPIGGRLWILSREKLTAGIIPRATELAHQALQWLVDGRHITSTEVTGEIDKTRLKLLIKLDAQNN